jgi:hypothetical protein
MTDEKEEIADANKQKLKELTTLFFIQVILYGILCINYRAVADAEYHLAALSDFTIASLNFFVIKKISKSEDSFHQWLGYVVGSVVGSYLGIYISTLLH